MTEKKKKSDKHGFKRTVYRYSLSVLLLTVAVLFLCFGNVIIDISNHIVSKSNAKLGEKLYNDDGLLFLATFDETLPKDSVSNTDILCWDSPKVKGKYKSARRLKADSNNAVLQSVGTINGNTEELTVSLWVKPAEFSSTQNLFVSKTDKCSIKLFLEFNKIALTLSDNVGREISRISQDLFLNDDFIHLAITVCKEKASLYFKGRQVGTVGYPGFEITVKPGPIIFSKQSHDPFCGDIDDYAIFSRVLSDNEILKIASSDFSTGNRTNFCPVELDKFYNTLNTNSL